MSPDFWENILYCFLVINALTFFGLLYMQFIVHKEVKDLKFLLKMNNRIHGIAKPSHVQGEMGSSDRLNKTIESQMNGLGRVLNGVIGSLPGMPPSPQAQHMHHRRPPQQQMEEPVDPRVAAQAASFLDEMRDD